MNGNLKNDHPDRLRVMMYYNFHIAEKYSVDSVAQKMGIHRDTLYKWINGTNTFPANEIIDLIKATGDISYLEFIADKCGYALIPKIKDRKTAETVLFIAKMFLMATEGKFDPEKEKTG